MIITPIYFRKRQVKLSADSANYHAGCQKHYARGTAPIFRNHIRQVFTMNTEYLRIFAFEYVLQHLSIKFLIQKLLQPSKPFWHPFRSELNIAPLPLFPSPKLTTLWMVFQDHWFQKQSPLMVGGGTDVSSASLILLSNHLIGSSISPFSSLCPLWYLYPNLCVHVLYHRFVCIFFQF